MEFKYTMTRDDIKKLLYQKSSRYDYIILIMSSTYYIILGICLSFLSFGLFYLSYLIFLAVIWLFITAINKIYVNYLIKINDKATNNSYGEFIVNIDDEQIIDKIDDKEYKILWSNVKRVVYKKDLIIVFPNTTKPKMATICLMFYREFFNNKKDYDKFKSFIEQKIPPKK